MSDKEYQDLLKIDISSIPLVSENYNTRFKRQNYNSNEINEEFEVLKLIESKQITQDEIDLRTVKFLKGKILTDEPYDFKVHKCLSRICNPLNVTSFSDNEVKITIYNAFELNYNCDIYYCKYGKFHDCGEICSGNITNSCPVTGHAKNQSFSSFETHVKTYFNPSPTVRNIDNISSQKHNSTLMSYSRDDKLNSLIIDKTKIEVKKSQEISEKRKMKHMRNRKKGLTRELINKKTWIGENIEEIVRFIDIYTLKNKCTRKSVQRRWKENGTIVRRHKNVKNSEKSFIMVGLIYNFLKVEITREQIYVQSQEYDYLSFFKNFVVDGFFYVDNIKKTIKIAWKDVKEFLDLCETWLLQGILPGFYRLIKSTPTLFEKSNEFNAKGIKYLQICKSREKKPNYWKYCSFTSFDIQENNDKHIFDDEENKTNSFVCIKSDLTSFPTGLEMLKILGYLLIIYALVKNSGNGNHKRETVDATNIILGGIFILKNGFSKRRPNKDHEKYIPRIPFLDNPGYLPFLNKLSKITGIKDVSKYTKTGRNCIYSTINYYYQFSSYSAEEIKIMILNAGGVLLRNS